MLNVPRLSQHTPKDSELSAGVYHDSRELRGKRIHSINPHCIATETMYNTRGGTTARLALSTCCDTRKKVNTMEASGPFAVKK